MIYRTFQDIQLSNLGMGAMRLPVIGGDDSRVDEETVCRMVDKAMSDANYGKLETSIHAGDKDAAFEAAHALKGVLSNLSLTPILDPVVEITELLRSRADADYEAILLRILAKKRELDSLS